jgi:D-lactate dehydrogenase (cytochrome)
MNEQIQAEIKKIFEGRFSTSESTRANYARGEDTYDPILSQAVVFPETNEEVSKILKLCNENKIPVVPFGTGTSLEGNVVGNDKGITISLEKMNKILSVNVEDFDCRVQACVTREQLNDYLREDGVFFSNRSRSKCSAWRYGSDFRIWDYGCQVWHHENSDKRTYSCPCKW